MNTGHSPIGASSMHRWSVCPGSVPASQGVETIESEAAAEGTRAHALAATWLQGSGKMPPCDDDEMITNVKIYVDYVFSLMAVKDAKVWIEHGFDLSMVYPDLWGTNDAIVWQPDTRTLHVVDLKYGAGIFVSAENNSQLNYYALGALMTLGLPIETIVMTIVQPRCGMGDAIRSSTISAVDLMDFADDLVMYAQRTAEPNAPLKSGDHCRFCPAIVTCPEIARTKQEVAKLEFKDDPTVPYEPTALQKALDSIPVLQAWISAVESFGYKEAEAGRTPPGYKLVDKMARRQWREESEVSLFLGARSISADLIFEPKKLKSPAKMESAFPELKDLLAKFMKRESSGHALVTLDDKRPPVRLSAADDFLEITAVETPSVSVTLPPAKEKGKRGRKRVSAVPDIMSDFGMIPVSVDILDEPHVETAQTTDAIDIFAD